MAEVGVLNLEIQSNGDDAAKGLGALARNLGSVKEKATGFDLSNVASNIKNIVDAVKGSEKTMSSLGTLLNATSTYFKTFGSASNKISVNLKPIENLKKTIGDGFKLGNAGSQLSQLRTALSGEWNTGNIETIGNALSTIANGAKGVDTANLGEVATNVSAVAKALSEYADAAAKVKDAVGVGGGSNSGQVGSNMSLGSSGFKMGLQFFGGKGETNATEQMKMDLEGLMQTTTSVVQQMTDGMSSVASSIQDANNANNELLQTSAAITEQERQTTAQIQERVQVSQGLSLQDREAIRLESNYDRYRDLWTNGGGNWKYDIEKQYGFTPRAFQEGETYAEALKITLEDVNKAVDEFIEKTNQPSGPLLRDTIDQSLGMWDAVKWAPASAEVLGNVGNVENVGNIKKVAETAQDFQQVQSAVQATDAAFTGATQKTTVLTESMEDLDRELQHKQGDFRAAADAAHETSSSFSELMFGAQGLHGAFQRMFPTLTGLTKRFAGMAKMRAMRYIIRQVAAGFSEGVQNMYQYSSAIGSALAPAMDVAASSLAQFKNSIGAAAAPIITALVPALQTVIGWLIQAINLLNQFFALLGGQATWTRALQTETKALNDTKKAAGGAGGAMKDLLADWDELNIIQSQGGGGGGGGGGALGADYANMFEEVGEFTGWVKDLVDGIKDQFGDIWGLVKRIGAVLLGWKISNAFEGLIGKLGGILATLGIIDLVFNIVTMFDNNYIKTGEEGWLIADLLTTVVGAHFAGVVLKKALGGTAGEIAIPLTFVVSAAASIIANLSHTDVSALDEKSIKTSLVAALKGGVAAGYLAHMVGQTLGESLIGGAVGAIATFGVAMTLKADANVAADGITKENVAAAILGIGSLGIAGAATGASLAEAAGVGVGVAATGMAMLFGGAAVITLGAAVGINAINTAAEAGEITSEVIEKNLLAGGIVGAGLALVAGATIGSGLAVAIVGVGGAVLTIAALFAIEATIDKHPAIKWGDYEATVEEIKNFVENEVFETDANTILKLVDPKIEAVSTSEEGLKASVGEVQLLVKKLTVGINEDDTLHELEEKLFGNSETGTEGLFDKFKKTAKAHQELIETGITLVPTAGTNDDGSPKEIIDILGEGWDMLNGHMKDLARQLTDSFARAYSDGISDAAKQSELRTITELTQMAANVAAAMERGELTEGALQNLVDNIQNMDKGSWDTMFDYINQYKEEVAEAYKKVYDEVTRSIAKEAAGLQESITNEYTLADMAETEAERNGHLRKAKAYEDEYKLVKDILDSRRAGRDQAIKDAADAAMNEDTIEQVRTAFLSLIDESLDFRDYVPTIPGGLQSVYLSELLGKSGKIDEESKGAVEEWLAQFIRAAFPEPGDADTVLKAIERGIAGYGDIINREAIDMLADELGITGTEYEVQWNEIMKNFFGDGTATRNAAQSAAEQVEEIVEEAAGETGTVQMQAGADLDVEVSANYSLIKGEGEDAKGMMEDLLGMGLEADAEYETTVTSDVKESVKDATEGMEPVDVTVPVDIGFEIVNAVLNGGDINEVFQEMIKKYGVAGVNSQWNEIVALLEDYDMELPHAGTIGSTGRPWRTSPNSTLSNTNYSKINNENTGTGDEDVIDYNQMANSVQSGTSRANTNVISELQVIATRLSALLAKNWTVNINATSSLGAVNSAASAAWGKVTGP